MSQKLTKRWKKLTKKWKKRTKRGKTLAIGLTLVVLLLLVFLFVPIVRVSDLVEESYLTTETYYVKESYIEEEPYTVLEPYTAIEAYCDEEPCQKYIPIDYSVVSGEGYNYYDYKAEPACSIEVYIQNTDVISGIFTVEFLLTLHGDATTTVAGTKYIEAGNTRKVVATYLGGFLVNSHSFVYSVTAPTKANPTYREEEVTKYREVTEYGEVTKYEYVPEEVTVVKTRTVTVYKRVSVLRYLISY